jgi:protein-tyrosine phosphatase
MSDNPASQPRRFHLLFVCLGNICRSPAAEGVMRQLVEQAGLTDRIRIDSAGTANWHTGKPADQRMREAAAERGYDLASLARQVAPSDFQTFDLILTMDNQNMHDLGQFDPARQHEAKARLFCEFCTQHKETQVPDPYYGGYAGFHHVIDLLEDGCRNLLRHIQRELDLPTT